MKSTIHEGPKDISEHIEVLKGCREETPAVAAVPSAPLRMYKSASESIKAAKAEEFPMRPAKAPTTLRKTQEKYAKKEAKGDVMKLKKAKKHTKKDDMA